MYTIIALFYISLLVIIAMIYNKHREIKTGHPSFISRCGTRTDAFFALIFATVKTWYSYLNKRTFITVIQWIAFHVLLNVREVYVWIKHQFISHPHGKKMIDAVRGRGQIKKHGASFYLRKIAAEEER